MSGSAMAKSGIKNPSSRLVAFHETQRNADRTFHKAMRGEVTLPELVASIRSAHEKEHELERVAQSDLYLFNQQKQQSFRQRLGKFISENSLLEPIHLNLEVGISLIKVGVARFLSSFSRQAPTDPILQEATPENVTTEEKSFKTDTETKDDLSTIKRGSEEILSAAA